MAATDYSQRCEVIHLGFLAFSCGVAMILQSGTLHKAISVVKVNSKDSGKVSQYSINGGSYSYTEHFIGTTVITKFFILIWSKASDNRNHIIMNTLLTAKN